MKFSKVYFIHKILKAIWQFIKDWWMLIALGITLYLLTKTDML